MERLDGKYYLESKGSAFSCTPAGVNTTLPSIYKRSIMLVLKGVYFLHDPSYCYSTVLEYLAYRFAFCSRIVLFLRPVQRLGGGGGGG